MDILYPKLFVFAVSVDILCAYRTPAAPAIAAEMVNAISLYFVMLIPIDSAAIRLSRIAMIARPSLELIRFCTINNVSRIRIKPITNVEFFGVPVIPCGPFRITVPSASIFNAITSFVVTWNPLESFPI